MPIWLQIVAAISGILSPFALFLCALLVRWLSNLQHAQAECSKELGSLRAHVAEQYVRSPEVGRLSDEIAGLRHSFDEGMKVIYKLEGALQNKQGG